MSHRQIVPLVFAAAVHSHIHQLPHHLMPSPDLGHRLQLSVRCKGDDGLDLEHGAGHSRDLADPAALHQILQRIHRKEGIGVGDELRSPALRQFFPVHAVFDVLSQLQHRHALTQSAADRVKHLHGIALLRTFSRQDPGQIIGPGQAAGQHDGDHAVISQIKDLPELRAEVLHTGQGGLGQLAVMKPLINIRAGDVDAVQIFAVLAQDPQRDKKDIVFPGLIPTQVGTGVRQQGNFLWGHFFCSFLPKSLMVQRILCHKLTQRASPTRFLSSHFSASAESPPAPADHPSCGQPLLRPFPQAWGGGYAS